MDLMIQKVFRQIDAVAEIIPDILGEENVLEVHSSELVHNPKKTISEVLGFLGVEPTEHYLDVCAEKVFNSVSRSRDLVVWTPEQIKNVEKRMRRHKMCDRYTFTSD